MLSETHKIVKGLAPAADRFNTSPSTDIYHLAEAENITFLVIHQGGTTGQGTFTVEACDNVTPSNTEAIAFRYRRLTTGASDTIGAPATAAATGIDSVAAEDTIIEISVRASELPAGKGYVRLKCAEKVNDPVNACVVAILGGLRYGGVNQPSALT